MDEQTQEQDLALERLGVSALRQRYAETFGEATKVANKAWLIKRIAWRLQALAEGDLSERARRRAAELADDADLRLNPPRAKREDDLKPTPRWRRHRSLRRRRQHQLATTRSCLRRAASSPASTRGVTCK
jgi:hypothetical protein